MRKSTGSHGARTGASMTTEYQDRFLPPHCHKAVVSTTTHKNHHHPLKGTSNDQSTYRLFYVTHRRIKHPQKAPQLKALQASTPARVHPAGCSANASQLEDYTSVYKNDFRAWTTIERHRFRRDPARTVVNSKAVPQQKERPPFEGVTSYRSDYVAHPMPPRAQEKKPRHQTNKGLPVDPAPPFTKKVINQEPSDGASDRCKHFHTWSLKTSHGSDQASSEPADLTFPSTAHAHYTAHRCQRTRPILPPMNTRGKSKEPFQATTTTREDYRARDTPRHVPAEVLPACGPAPAQSRETNPKSLNLHLKWNKTAVCHATELKNFPPRMGIKSPGSTGPRAWTEKSPGLMVATVRSRLKLGK